MKRCYWSLRYCSVTLRRSNVLFCNDTRKGRYCVMLAFNFTLQSLITVVGFSPHCFMCINQSGGGGEEEDSLMLVLLAISSAISFLRNFSLTWDTNECI